MRERVEQMQQMTLADFTRELSENAPVPGGGVAAALCGALAAALSSMVASLTVGKKKYEAVREDMDALIQDAGRLREEFLSLIDEDAEAFKPLAAAYRLPHGTEEEKAARRNEMEQALRHGMRDMFGFTQFDYDYVADMLTEVVGKDYLKLP